VNSLWVVVPAFDEQDYVAGTIRALAGQHDRAFRTLLVDNACTDRTVAVALAEADRLGLWLEVVREPRKGTGAAADTGFRAAIAAGATRLARTDADCLPRPDWTAAIRRGFDSGLELIAGRLVPRRDEPGVTLAHRWLLPAAVSVASAFGAVRPGNRGREYLGRYVMTPGCNLAITADLYQRAGGFPRVAIEEQHEDRALVNAVRRISTAYGPRRDVVVAGSTRRVRAWGLARTLGWYADHRYRPDLVDVR
jgi:glycosyltransferase involved in cell wall biosynthesis